MKSCLKLIGQMCPSWLLIGCIISMCCLQVEGEEGAYGSTCKVNSDCQLGFVCLSDKCTCESSYFYDNNGVCKKICRGSSEGLTRLGKFDHWYAIYKTRYTNCSYVDGNLEIVSLEGAYDLGFLKDIEEIDGYLLVVNVFSNYLNLTKLRIIRGNQLFPFENDSYSMFIALNHNPSNDSQGLMELQFKSLTEIVRGHVYFKNNNLLCFLNTILWSDINPYSVPHARVIFNSLNDRRQCPSCPANCYNPATNSNHCWGNSPDMCQKLNYISEVCSGTCDGRCFGSDQNECCHPECAAGCTGPRKTNCLACKNFYSDGECHALCPRLKIFDQNQFKWVDNPDGRYSWGSLCVKDCPNDLVKDNEACVIKCPDNKYADKLTNVCEDCEGACPKKCSGVSDSSFINSKNIQDFKGCTIVEGNLKIMKVSFEGDPHQGTEGIKVEDLQLLKDIKEITGYLTIQEAPSEVKDLSFLSALEEIHGHYLLMGLGISILSMDVEWLGLTSLKKVWNGNIALAWNQNLCYIEGLDLSSIFAFPAQQLNLKDNQDPVKCAALGLKCHSECSRHGCWGPGPDKCLQCKTVRMAENNTCLASCNDMPMLYLAENDTCKPCHQQCAGGCTGPVCQPCDYLCLECNGPGNANCQVCRYFSYRNRFLACVDTCPTYTFPHEGECLVCSEQCLGGCYGSNTTECNNCLNFKVFIDEEKQLFSCVEKCPENQPHLVEDKDPDKPTMTVCASDDHPEVMARDKERGDEERKKILTIALPVCATVILLGILLALFGYYWRQGERAKETRLKLTAKMTGVADTEELCTLNFER